LVSVGNKADVSGNDLLEYWDSDPRTHVILLYLESFGNPRRFARLARRISRSKPIVAVIAGRTRAGSRAADSHTAALAASDTAVAALFHQSGVIRADTIDEMFDIATCLDAQPLPKGGRVAIVTNAGGPGIMAVDACVAAGLTVTEFSTTTCARLGALLPSTATVCNPVDMVASAGPEEYRQTIEVPPPRDEADALIVIYTPVDTSRSEEIPAAIREGVRAARRTGGSKPVLACVMTDGRPPAPLRVDGETIPSYAFPENAARALAKIAAYSLWRSQPPGLFWGFDGAAIDPQAQDKHMMEMRQTMMTKMHAADAELDRLVADMNAATGDAKVAAIAGLLTRMVQQRTQMRGDMQESMKTMMVQCYTSCISNIDAQGLSVTRGIKPPRRTPICRSHGSPRRATRPDHRGDIGVDGSCRGQPPTRAISTDHLAPRPRPQPPAVPPPHRRALAL
jgi:acyl-CoA synthetase (NDP forming)